MRKLIKKWVEGSEYEPLAIALRELSMGKGERLGRRDNRLLKLLISYILKEDSNCIDLGAHKGVMLSDMYSLSPNGQHYAFEPLSVLATELKDRFSSVFQIALSDEEGMVEFYRNVIDPGYSGLKQGLYKKGQGPLSKEDFSHITDKGLAWNFIACLQIWKSI